MTTEHPSVPSGTEFVQSRGFDGNPDQVIPGHALGTAECRAWAVANGEHPHIVTVDRIGTPMMQFGIGCSCGEEIVALTTIDVRLRPPDEVIAERGERDRETVERHYDEKHEGRRP